MILLLLAIENSEDLIDMNNNIAQKEWTIGFYLFVYFLCSLLQKRYLDSCNM